MLARMRLMKDQRGLTLIELLAVIVILGIIAAIAVPSIGGIISKTDEKAKVAEAVQIINAAKLAHAAEGYPTGGWESTAAANPLSSYISNVSDNTWTVTWSSANGYRIQGHESAPIINSDFDATTLVTEKQLTDYLGQ